MLSRSAVCKGSSDLPLYNGLSPPFATSLTSPLPGACVVPPPAAEVRTVSVRGSGGTEKRVSLSSGPEWLCQKPLLE